MAKTTKAKTAKVLKKDLVKQVFWGKRPEAPEGYASFPASSEFVRNHVSSEEWDKSLREQYYAAKIAAWRIRRMPHGCMRLDGQIKPLPSPEQYKVRDEMLVPVELTVREKYLLSKIGKKEHARSMVEIPSTQEHLLSLRWKDNNPDDEADAQAYARAAAEKLNAKMILPKHGEMWCSLVRDKTNMEMKQEVERMIENAKGAIQLEKFFRDEKKRSTLVDLSAAVQLFEKSQSRKWGMPELPHPTTVAFAKACVDTENMSDKEIEKLAFVERL